MKRASRTKSNEETFILPFPSNMAGMMGEKNSDRIRSNPTEDGLVHTIYLTDDIESPDQYTDEFELLANSDSNDMIVIVLNSMGGDLDTALQFVNYIKQCNSKVVAKVSGGNCSASTMIMLACDDWEVDEFSYTMIHTPSGGFVGRFPDSHVQSDFFRDFIKDFYEKMYMGFLSEDEVERLVDGKDYWFNSEDTKERLEGRREIVEEIKRASTVEFLGHVKNSLIEQIEDVEGEIERLQSVGEQDDDGEWEIGDGEYFKALCTFVDGSVPEDIEEGVLYVVEKLNVNPVGEVYIIHTPDDSEIMFNKDEFFTHFEIYKEDMTE